MLFRRSITAAIALALALPAPLAAQSRHLLEYPSVHSPVVGTRGMVVSQNAIASEVGAQILRDGGNAVDAAIAIGFALSVTLPRAGNIGGDGYMNVYDAASGQVRVIDFRSVALQGVGFGPRPTALQGLVPVEETGPPVSIGGAATSVRRRKKRRKDDDAVIFTLIR